MKHRSNYAKKKRAPVMPTLWCAAVFLAAISLTSCEAFHWTKSNVVKPQLDGDRSTNSEFLSTSSEIALPFSSRIPLGDAVNWSRQSGRYHVKMQMEPQSPKVNEEVSVTFTISEINSNVVTPVTNAQMACLARMPNIPGHIHITATHLQHVEIQPGIYAMHPIHFEMGGRWDWMLQLKASDGYEFISVFPIDVQGPPWPPNYMPENLKKP